MPLPPLVMVTQARLSVADHAQPLVVVIAMIATSPPAAIACVVGDTAKLHIPLCVMVTGCPATVSVPIRDVVDVFAVTV